MLAALTSVKIAVADVEQELDEGRVGGLHEEVPRRVPLGCLDELDLVIVVTELKAGGLRPLAVLVQLVGHALPVVARAETGTGRADDRFQAKRE